MSNGGLLAQLSFIIYLSSFYLLFLYYLSLFSHPQQSFISTIYISSRVNFFKEIRCIYLLFRYDNTHKIISAVLHTLQTIQSQCSCLKSEEIHLNKKTNKEKLQSSSSEGRLATHADQHRELPPTHRKVT